MASLNKVMLMGNLTRDPELRSTRSGAHVAEIGLAINRRIKLDNGETREEVTFVDVTFWGRQAEILHQHTAKGRPLYIEGRLDLDQWNDKQSGQNRQRLKVVGESFQFLGRKPSE